jgi:tetratricopeptide (TPR) repeat protein
MKTFNIKTILTVLCLAVSIPSICQLTVYEQAYQHYEDGDLETAIDLMDDSEADHLSDPRFFFLRGSCWSELGENALAIQDFNKSIELDDQNPETFYQRGFSYFSTKQSELAVKDFDQAIALDSEYAEAYVNRGSVHYDLGNQEKACADWQMAIDLGMSLGEQLYGELCN